MATLASAPPTTAASSSRMERWLSMFGLAGCQLTYPGRWALFGGTVLAAVGLYKGVNLLVLLGYSVPVVLLLNAWTTRPLMKFTALRRLPREIFAGAPVEVEVLLELPESGSPLGTFIVDRGECHLLRWMAPESASALVTLHARALLPRRGVYAWGRLAATCGAPFGLVERTCELTPAEPVLVLPQLGRIDRDAFLRKMSGHGQPASDRSRSHPQRHASARAEFHGLRPFRSGDSPRSVHWRTSARRGELMVREYEDFTGENLVVVLDLSAPASAAGVEAAISLAATLCWEWCRRRGDRLLLAITADKPALVEGISGPELGRAALELLARCTPTASRPDAVIDSLLELSPAPGPLVVIAPAATSLGERLQQALQRPANVIDPGRPLDFYQPPAPPPTAREG